MRIFTVTVMLALLATGSAFADDHAQTEAGEAATHENGWLMPFPTALPSAVELEGLLKDSSDTALADLTVDEFMAFTRLAKTAVAEELYVGRAVQLSHMMPGLGHYAIGERGKAWLFFTADVFIRGVAATLAYVVLPAPVKFANLNYLQTPMADIETRWMSLTPAQLLPSYAIGLSGAVLSGVVRTFAGRDAKEAAIEAVLSGTADLSPHHR